MAEGAPLLREYRVKNLIEGSNPSLSARYAKRPARGVLRIWRRERWWTNPMVIRRLLRLTLRAIGCADVRFGILPTRATILSGTLWTAAGWPWSAIARKGLAHGWAKQSPRTSRCLAPRRRAFCVSGGERWWTNPPGFDNFVWNIVDSRRLALERAARKSELYGWNSQSLANVPLPDDSSR